jgi:predicted RNase H-like nuclease (RuvC/YqgF family)
MDSDTGGGKPKLDLSDIMSMLDEGEQKMPEPKATKKAEAPRDNVFTKKLLADIERKNAENLKLSSENMSLKYSLSEKDMEIKKLRAQAEGLRGQVEGLKSQVMGLNQKVEDMSKYVNDARVKLGEMEADRSKLTTRIASRQETAPPEDEDEDVASIFKRIALEGEEPTGGQSGEGAEKLQKKLKTAKLYDL